MADEKGFTLIEVLVSLLILSALAVTLTAITQNILSSWSRIDQRSHRADEMMAHLEQLEDTEKQLKGPASAKLLFDRASTDGSPLHLASPKIDRHADCIYDLVGRRCR